jgi:hypothetical protein
MSTLIEILASFAILANGVIYGTDVFGAILLPPPSPRSTIAPHQALGHVHCIADRRSRGSAPAA